MAEIGNRGKMRIVFFFFLHYVRSGLRFTHDEAGRQRFTPTVAPLTTDPRWANGINPAAVRARAHTKKRVTE